MQSICLTHVHFRRVLPAFGTVFIGTVPKQLAANDVASVWTLWLQSSLGPRKFVGFFVGYSRSPQPEHRAKKKKTKQQYTNMFVCLYGCLSQSLPCPLVCSHAFVVLLWFVWLVDVLWVFLCAWYLCVVYVKSSSNDHTKPQESFRHLKFRF